MAPITLMASRDGWDVVAVEVLPAFLGCQVPVDATASEREQEINVHGIDLDDSVGSRRKKAAAIRRPNNATHGGAVRSESEEFAAAGKIPDSNGLVITS
jgi:hypothetical protein